MKNTKTGITICRIGETPNDSCQYHPENKHAKKYKSINSAVSVCDRLLKKYGSGWVLGITFNQFFVVIDDRFPIDHELNQGIRIFFN